MKITITLDEDLSQELGRLHTLLNKARPGTDFQHFCHFILKTSVKRNSKAIRQMVLNCIQDEERKVIQNNYSEPNE